MNNLEALKNAYHGETCFVLGTGPSLNKINFKLLRDKHLFGTNTFYRGIKKFGVMPTWYAVSDGFVWSEHGKLILEAFSGTLFLVDQAAAGFRSQCLPIGIPPILLTHLGYIWRDGRMSLDAEVGVYNGDSIVADIPLQVCYWMGFQQIILLGCDLDYSGDHRFDGLASENKNAPGLHGDFSKAIKSFEIIKETYEANGREIINCSPGTKLNVFEKADLENIL